MLSFTGAVDINSPSPASPAQPSPAQPHTVEGHFHGTSLSDMDCESYAGLGFDFHYRYRLHSYIVFITDLRLLDLRRHNVCGTHETVMCAIQRKVMDCGNNSGDTFDYIYASSLIQWSLRNLYLFIYYIAGYRQVTAAIRNSYGVNGTRGQVAELLRSVEPEAFAARCRDKMVTHHLTIYCLIHERALEFYFTQLEFLLDTPCLLQYRNLPCVAHGWTW